MNKVQKIIIAIVGFLIIAIMLFPPYTIKYRGVTILSGYKFLFAFSKITRSLHYSINIPVLIIQCLIVLVLGVIAFIFAKDKPFAKVKNKDKQNNPLKDAEPIKEPIKNEKEQVINYEHGLQNQNESKTMPTKWLNFWIYFRLPVSAIFIFFSAIILVKNIVILIFFIGWSIFLLVVARGLHYRRLWAWKLLWLILVSDFLYTMQFEEAVEKITAFLITLFLWFVPNLIYFKKRKILFSK